MGGAGNLQFLGNYAISHIHNLVGKYATPFRHPGQAIPSAFFRVFIIDDVVRALVIQIDAAQLASGLQPGKAYVFHSLDRAGLDSNEVLHLPKDPKDLKKQTLANSHWVPAMRVRKYVA